MEYLSCVFLFLCLFGDGHAQPGKKSQEYCKLLKQVKTNSIVAPGLVGATPAGEYEFNHMAALGYGNDTHWASQCGGSLINDKVVLTAAHCASHKVLGDVIFVRLGTKNIYEPESTYKDYDVFRIIQHPGYTNSSLYNDIALIRLQHNVVFSHKIKPACLDTSNDVPDTGLIATGWGLTQEDPQGAPYLLKLSLVKYNHSTCNEKYKDEPELPNGLNPFTMICAGGEKDELKGVCGGDSGGPLQITIYSGLYRIVGISSFGKVCLEPNVPDVYTKVFNYIRWIEENAFQ